MKKKVLISTGGSGGHVVPAITIYNHLKHTYETFISTDIRGLAYLERNCKAFVINTPKLNNYFLLPFSFLKILFLTVKSFFLLKNKSDYIKLRADTDSKALKIKRAVSSGTSKGNICVPWISYVKTPCCFCI